MNHRAQGGLPAFRSSGRANLSGCGVGLLAYKGEHRSPVQFAIFLWYGNAPPSSKAGFQPAKSSASSAAKVQDGQISPALLPAFAVYDTAEKFDQSTYIALT